MKFRLMRIAFFEALHKSGDFGVGYFVVHWWGEGLLLGAGFHDQIIAVRRRRDFPAVLMHMKFECPIVYVSRFKAGEVHRLLRGRKEIS